MNRGRWRLCGSGGGGGRGCEWGWTWLWRRVRRVVVDWWYGVVKKKALGRAEVGVEVVKVELTTN
jgi:hypothetical protein